MFEFFFKYPRTVFDKGNVVLLSHWPVWLLWAAMAAAGAVLAILIWRRSDGSARLAGVRTGGIWLLQTLLVSLILLMLWHPAISVATLRPQQNVVAVLIDDSRSMAIQEDGESRQKKAVEALQSSVLNDLRKNFQVRLYRFGSTAERFEKLEQLTAQQPSTRIGASLQQVTAEAASLPVGAVVLVSDGGDTTGGIDLDTLQQIRRRRIPVHTVGVGSEAFKRDVELLDAEMPAQALADSRVAVTVTFSQHGYGNGKGKLILREGRKALSSRDITFKGDGERQTETLVFNGGPAGARTVEASIDPLPDEENKANNSLTRVMTIEGKRPRILYIEGEPRWEYKFIRRAVEDDKSLQVVGMLRTTQNKIYRQGIERPQELEEGFPAKVDDLFGYDGLIIGSVEAGYFTPAQQELIQQFVDRRGGGALFLGGRFALSEGGWPRSAMAAMLPVTLPDRKGTFQRDPAKVELTAAGRESLICRLEENPDQNVERWKKLPEIANYQDVGVPKPGATTLADYLLGGNRRSPLLVVENYGRGRTALLASAGTWRWQMMQDHTDRTHEVFWSQLLRWLVTGTPGRVTASTPLTVLSDQSHLKLQATVRDRNYLPLSDAAVSARVLGPDGGATVVPLTPDPKVEGAYEAEWTASSPGAYLVETTAKRGDESLGSDVYTFRREDGVAENFHSTQNRELLEKLADQTGGHYYPLRDVKNLAKEITYSEAGFTSRETKDLWDMPIVFLMALLLRSSEWLLRRRWGVV